MNAFDREVADHQVEWRQKHIESKEQGKQNGRQYPWIVPMTCWKETLWPGIQRELPEYLAEHGVQRHSGCHNLKSSWILCANLYFSFRSEPTLLASFLSATISTDIDDVIAVELEHVEPIPNDASTLLGEPGGQRGASQTSPDVAFRVSLKSGEEGLLLVESKFTEHSFYSCAGRDRKYGNPDPARCLDIDRVCEALDDTCYLTHWETQTRSNRRYWEHLRISDHGRSVLQQCPASTAGYQLFRQQALAEGIAQSDKYGNVWSCVAWDDRNRSLARCLKSTGVDHFESEWAELFDGQARFATFTHQSWVQWVHEHDAEKRWSDWLTWVCERYDYRFH